MGTAMKTLASLGLALAVVAGSTIAIAAQGGSHGSPAPQGADTVTGATVCEDGYRYSRKKKKCVPIEPTGSFH